MITFRQYLKEALKDPGVKREYDNLAPEFAIMEAIIKRRVEKKVTQKSLAQKLHTKQSAISRLESGMCNPSLKLLRDVAKALDCRLKISFIKN